MAPLDSVPVPGHWDEVLADLRASPLSSLSVADILAEATGLLIVAPTAEVVEACFGEVLTALEESGVGPVSGDKPGDAPPNRWASPASSLLTRSSRQTSPRGRGSSSRTGATDGRNSRPPRRRCTVPWSGRTPAATGRRRSP